MNIELLVGPSKSVGSRYQRLSNRQIWDRRRVVHVVGHDFKSKRYEVLNYKLG